MNRGDVVLVFYPFASGAGGKRRPGLSLNLSRALRPAQRSLALRPAESPCDPGVAQSAPIALSGGDVDAYDFSSMISSPAAR